MKIAFTMDDLPLWPQSWPPAGYTAEGIVQSISEALDQNGITGVYAFSNSWPLTDHPHLGGILDDWVSAGHHIANHTHSHLQLPDVSVDAFIADIDEADRRLAPWQSKAPLKLFRHPLCHWGETEDKRRAVNTHLSQSDLTPVDVTSWAYEWTWNRAWRNALDAGDLEAQAYVKHSFLEFSVAQLRFDHAAACDWFGRDVIGLTLGHNVPFFAEIAADYFACLIAEGARFVPLDEALVDPVQSSTGSVVSGKFLVLQQKLADAAGIPTPQIVPEHGATHARITEMARGQTG